MIPQAGERLGPYEILGELGGGGMAVVLRAWDGRLHREVAIKLIHDRYAMPGIRERFLREARAASGLNHPNICTIFDIGEQGGEPYLVMELLEGETLKDRIGRGALSVEEIVRYGREIAEALALAHSKGIVHRDIKPANIFLVNKANGSAQAKVLDFGLAKVSQYAAREESSEELTTLGAAVGTVSYMSPEQARGEALDARSDLFSLGVVLYEMASGQLPFQGTTSALVFVQLLGQTPPESVRARNAVIPKELESVIFKLLARQSKARYGTAEEVCRALAEVGEKKQGWLARGAARLMTPGAAKTSSGRARAAKDEAEDVRAKSAKPANDAGRELGSGRDSGPDSAAVGGRAGSLGSPGESAAEGEREQSAQEKAEAFLRPKMPLPPEMGRNKGSWTQKQAQSPTRTPDTGVVLARPGDPQAPRFRPKRDSEDRRGDVAGSISQLRARAEAEPQQDASERLAGSQSVGLNKTEPVSSDRDRDRLPSGRQGGGTLQLGSPVEETSDREGPNAASRMQEGKSGVSFQTQAAFQAQAAFPAQAAPPAPASDRVAIERRRPAAPEEAERRSLRNEATGAASAAARSGPVRPSSRSANGPAGQDIQAYGAGAAIETGSDGRSGGRGRRWLVSALVSVVLLSALGWLYARRHRGAAAAKNDLLLLTRLKNVTGDVRLDMAVLEGLDIDLGQSKALRVRGSAEYEAALDLVRPKSADGRDDGMPDRIRLAAEKVGAKEYLTGEIRGSDDFGAPPYAITIDVMSVATNQRLMRIEDSAESKDRFADSIDRIADQVRSAMGESGESIAASNLPLKNDATGSIDALSAYFQAEHALVAGQRRDAMNLFEKAVAYDPKFIQGQLKLAMLDRDELSELKSVQASRLALVASAGTSERWRLTAQFRSALEVDGDYDAALRLIQQYATEYPEDAEGQHALAQVLRLEGRFTEALDAAQMAYTLDPFDVEGYAQAERTLLSLDKFDAMENLDVSMRRWNLAPASEALLGAYLAGHETQLADAIVAAKDSPDDDALALRYAVYLDNSGQLKAGQSVWLRRKAGPATAGATPGAASGAQNTTAADNASMVRETLASLNPSLNPSSNPDGARETPKAAFLAQGALNRALAGDCADALGMMRVAAAEAHGSGAEFNLGMTAGFCGEMQAASESLAALTRLLPHNTAARECYVPDLKALIALKSRDAEGALSNLQGSHQYDQISLTPYLLGLAHLAVNQPALAMADFQLVLSHRGAAAATSSTVYPMSQIGLARALAAAGDKAGSAAAYYRFIELWKDADPGQPLLVEARARTR